VWASTFGAGFGSLVSLSVLDPVGRSIGFADYVGSYSAGLLLLLAAAAVVQLRLRPDPLIVAGGTKQESGPRLPFTTSMRLILAHPQARLAVLGMMISQATMVGVMTLTPLHMKDGHQSGASISVMLFTHMMGMYLFSPFVGKLADRAGRYPVLAGAGVLCTFGAICAGLTPPHGFVGVTIGLVVPGGAAGQHPRRGRPVHGGVRRAGGRLGRRHRGGAQLSGPELRRRRARHHPRCRRALHHRRAPYPSHGR
jgi:hypothetical protein